jgi:ABC-type dipeptide/oligopeptide/nickel transport system ATPase subunit
VSPYEPAWYAAILRAVGLDRDLGVLKHGDATPPVRLSGGQRARVALARAVYSRAERVVLDDVFSALDAETEAGVWGALFDREEGLLRGKTVLLATHGSKFHLPFLLVEVDSSMLLVGFGGLRKERSLT